MLLAYLRRWIDRRRARVRAIRGKYKHVLLPSDQRMHAKQDEIDREDRDWRPSE